MRMSKENRCHAWLLRLLACFTHPTIHERYKGLLVITNKSKDMNHHCIQNTKLLGALFLAWEPNISLPMSFVYLAFFLGTSPENVSFNGLFPKKDKKWFDKPSLLAVPNLRSLRFLLSEDKLHYPRSFVCDIKCKNNSSLHGRTLIQFEHSRHEYTFGRNVLQSLQSSRGSRFVRHLEFLWFVLKRDTRIAPCILIGW